MNISILNECYLQPTHLNRLKKLGPVTVFHNTKTEQEAIDRLRNADIALIDGYFTPLTEPVLNAAKHLKFIALNSTGHEMVNLKLCSQRNIAVANVPGYATVSVAEMTLGLMLGIVTKTYILHKSMQQSPFEINVENTDHNKFLRHNLSGKTVGIVGLGRIGKHVAKLLAGFSCPIIFHDILTIPKSICDELHAQPVSFKELIKSSDIISLHIPYDTSTHHILNRATFDTMKAGVYIINTARGKLIETNALYHSLISGKVAGAGLDVLEAYTKDNPLISLENVILSPHSAWFSQESLDNLAEIITSNAESFMQKNPTNIVR